MRCDIFWRMVSKIFFLDLQWLLGLFLNKFLEFVERKGASHIFFAPWQRFANHERFVKASGDRTVHGGCNPSPPTLSLTGVESGAVCGMRHKVALRMFCNSSTDLVIIIIVKICSQKVEKNCQQKL